MYICNPGSGIQSGVYRGFATLAALLLLALPGVCAAQQTSRPNVVLILADDLGYNDISLHGNNLVRTPNIDAIGRNGVQFTRGHATAPVCSPSRVGLMSGRFQQRIGMENFPGPQSMFVMQAGGRDAALAQGGIILDIPADAVVPPDQMSVPQDTVLLSQVLKANNYINGVFGKWNIGAGPLSAPLNRGFDDYTSTSIFYGDADDPDMEFAKLPWETIDTFVWNMGGGKKSANRNGQSLVPDEDITAFIANEGARFIEEHKDDPFFLYLPFTAPHTPLQAPRSYYDRLDHIADHKTRVYYAMIESLDDAVGRIVDKLKELGLDENTLVIFSSDNGAAEYTRIPNTNQPFRGSKLTHYQGGVVVPLLMSWPAQIEPGAVYHHPVSLTDIYPTVAAATGSSIPDDQILDGKDLLPYIKGENGGIPHQTLIWRGGETKAILHGDYRMQVDGNQQKIVLYNVKDDIGERHNLADAMPEKVQELQDVLAMIESDFPPPLWSTGFYFRVTSDIWPDGPPEDAEYMYFSP